MACARCMDAAVGRMTDGEGPEVGGVAPPALAAEVLAARTGVVAGAGAAAAREPQGARFGGVPAAAAAAALAALERVPRPPRLSPLAPGAVSEPPPPLALARPDAGRVPPLASSWTPRTASLATTRGGAAVLTLSLTAAGLLPVIG